MFHNFAHVLQYCTLYCTAPVCRWIARVPGELQSRRLRPAPAPPIWSTNRDFQVRSNSMSDGRNSASAAIGDWVPAKDASSGEFQFSVLVRHIYFGFIKMLISWLIINNLTRNHLLQNQTNCQDAFIGLITEQGKRHGSRRLRPAQDRCLLVGKSVLILNLLVLSS